VQLRAYPIRTFVIVGLVWRPRANGYRWVGSDAGLPVGYVGHKSIGGAGTPDRWHATRQVEGQSATLDLGWCPSAEAAMVAVDDSLEPAGDRGRRGPLAGPR
jgi:hypothetical protein